MDNRELKQQLLNIVKALSTIAVKGDDVLTLAQVFKGLEYTIDCINDAPVQTMTVEEE